MDTGYTGFLTLPPALANQLGLPFAYVGRERPAHVGPVEFNVHSVTLLWDGEPRDVEADATGSIPLGGYADA